MATRHLTLLMGIALLAGCSETSEDQPAVDTERVTSSEDSPGQTAHADLPDQQRMSAERNYFDGFAECIVALNGMRTLLPEFAALPETEGHFDSPEIDHTLNMIILVLEANVGRQGADAGLSPAEIDAQLAAQRQRLDARLEPLATFESGRLLAGYTQSCVSRYGDLRMDLP